jgi:hypothetical protein
MGKVKLILVFLVVSTLYTYSLSQHYAIKTVYKGDSVVIISNNQINEINNLFTTQKNRIEDFKLEVSDLSKENTKLTIESKNKDKIIDSLNLELKKQNQNIDEIKNRLDISEKWILESSINSCYLYYSWEDSTIKKISTEIFMLVGYRRTGNFSLVRMANNKDANDFIRTNWSQKQYPPLNWELNYKEPIRPIIINYPFKINF